MSASAAPAGDVTLMFTDIEGSTRKWTRYQEGFRPALDCHNALVREALAAWDGYEVKTIGDAFMAAFSHAEDAVLCALDIQRRIETADFSGVGGLRVRIGLHSAALEPHGGDYHGAPVNLAARIADAAHGGMILLSEETARHIEADLPLGASLKDLGPHRLKDLGSERRLFRLTHPDLPDRDYPPLRTLNALTNNFPAQVTSFIGRQREMAEIGHLISRRGARLVTLTGPGGTGKTRLGMQVAADNVQHYPDGVWLVELAHLKEAREVPTAVALALRVPLTAPEDAQVQVFAFLRTRKSLLVLDNFEQVIDAARFVGDLLRECPDVVCLVTSRQLLQIGGEYEYPLAPLALPPAAVSLDTCLDYESMRLFVERGQAARAGFTLTEETVSAVAAICRRLEGLPLAVELTANLVRNMTPQQILPRLQDRFRLLETTRRDLEPRQRSLRGAVDWSFDLLSEEERTLFTELSVFAGGFSMEDAEAVCSASDPFLLVFALRDKSLLRIDDAQDEPRYSMLETLREYGLEKRERQGRLDLLRERHAAHFLEKAGRLAEQLTEGDPVEAGRRMTVDIDNMRAGMAWAEAKRDRTMITGYSTALARYFQRRGPYPEAARWLALAEEGERELAAQEDASAGAREDSHTHRLAHILLQRGLIHYKRADYTAAVPCFEECLRLFRHLGDWRRVISSLYNLGNIAWATSRYEEAAARWEEALGIGREQGITRYEGDLLTNLAALAHQRGKAAEARNYSEQAIALHTRAGDSEGLAYACLNYGDFLLMQAGNLDVEDSEQAARLLELASLQLQTSEELFQAMGNSEGIAQTTERLGLLALLQGDLTTAEERCRRALELSRENDDRRCRVCAQRDLGRIALQKAAASDDVSEAGNAAREATMREAALHLSAALALAEELSDTGEVSAALHYAGEWARRQGRPEAAYLAYRVSLRECSHLHEDCSAALRRAAARAAATLSAPVRAQIEARAAGLPAQQAAEEALGAFPSART